MIHVLNYVFCVTCWKTPFIFCTILHICIFSKIKISIYIYVKYICLQDSARNLTLKVLLSIKSNQMDDCLAQLDRDLVDVLMKYIYRGFEIPTEGSSSHLLIWHEKVFNISGVGCIVRVFSDSKRAWSFVHFAVTLITVITINSYCYSSSLLIWGCR